MRNILFDYRYRTAGGFQGQNFRKWKSTACYGNSIMYIDDLDTRWTGGQPGLRYRAVPLGQCFFIENHQGIVVGMVRWWRMTAIRRRRNSASTGSRRRSSPRSSRTCRRRINSCIASCRAISTSSTRERLDVKGMPFSSHYVSIEGQCLMAEEGGYRVFPYAVDRYDQNPDEVYGRGPLQLALPGVKTTQRRKVDVPQDRPPRRRSGLSDQG